MKNKLGGKIMTKFVELRAKTYSYLTDDDSENRSNSRNSLEATQVDNRLKYLQKKKINIDTL